MNKMMTAIRSHVDRANTRRALRHLDNHLLNDIGMPPRERRTTFGPF